MSLIAKAAWTKTLINLYFFKVESIDNLGEVYLLQNLPATFLKPDVNRKWDLVYLLWTHHWNVEFNFDVCVDSIQFLTHLSKNLISHLHTFDVRFWPIHALMSKILHRSRFRRWVLSVIYAFVWLGVSKPYRLSHRVGAAIQLGHSLSDRQSCPSRHVSPERQKSAPIFFGVGSRLERRKRRADDVVRVDAVAGLRPVQRCLKPWRHWKLFSINIFWSVPA